MGAAAENVIRPPDLMFVNVAFKKLVYDSAVPDKSAPVKSELANVADARFAPLKSMPRSPTDMFDRSTLGPIKYPARIWYPDPA